jgi:hypothetical protein
MFLDIFSLFTRPLKNTLPLLTNNSKIYGKHGLPRKTTVSLLNNNGKKGPAA